MEHPDELTRCEKELTACILEHWKFCAAGVMMGMPLSIHRKSYFPFAVGGVIGTMC